MGEKILALDNLDKAIALGYEDLDWLMEETDLASIQTMPRFIAAIEKIRATKE